jgi:PilZ domain
MKHTIIERRAHPRFDLRLPLHYRVTQKGVAPYIGNGLSLDLSVGGISFRCRRPLPVGAQIELLVDWPAKYGELFPIELQVIGFVLRSAGGRTAVRMLSHRLRVSEVPSEPVRASA